MLLLLPYFTSIALLLLKLLGDTRLSQGLLLHSSVVASIGGHGEIIILDHLTTDLLP